MSMRRLCVRTSKCSRESLSLNGLRITQYTFFSVGRGTGPVIVAPLRCAVSTICWADRSSCWWSYPLRRIRIFPCAMTVLALVLLDHFGDDAGADGAAALADREAEALIHGDRLGLLDLRVDADDRDLVADLDLALLDAARDDGAATRDREHVFDRHQERLVRIADRLRDVGVDGLHQLEDLGRPRLVALERLQRRDADDRD